MRPLQKCDTDPPGWASGWDRDQQEFRQTFMEALGRTAVQNVMWTSQYKLPKSRISWWEDMCWCWRTSCEVSLMILALSIPSCSDETKIRLVFLSKSHKEVFYLPFFVLHFCYARTHATFLHVLGFKSNWSFSVVQRLSWAANKKGVCLFPSALWLFTSHHLHPSGTLQTPFIWWTRDLFTKCCSPNSQSLQRQIHQILLRTKLGLHFNHL